MIVDYDFKKNLLLLRKRRLNEMEIEVNEYIQRNFKKWRGMMVKAAMSGQSELALTIQPTFWETLSYKQELYDFYHCVRERLKEIFKQMGFGIKSNRKAYSTESFVVVWNDFQ